MWTLIIIIVVVVVVDDDTNITGFTCPPTIYFKFITKCDKCYYKVRQLFLLQSAMVCYYKVRQVLQSVTILLQSATGITKCDDYCKVRQYIRPQVNSGDSLVKEPNIDFS